MLFFSILLASSTLGIVITDYNRAFTFINENINGLLRVGEFPKMFGLGSRRIQAIGCKYIPSKFKWGLQNGYYCVRDRSAPMVREDSIASCNDMFSLPIAVICPQNWKADCGKGCVAPEIAEVQSRMDFWELTIAEIIKAGYHYSAPTTQFLKECGCDGQVVRLIQYGSEVGYECELRDGWQDVYDSETCWNGFQLCQNQGKDILTFCPIGYMATCTGCIPGVPGLAVDAMGNIDDTNTKYTSTEEQLGWLVDVLAGYARQSQTFLGWMPTPSRALACACKEQLMPVKYGLHIGYWCSIWEPASVDAHGCGTTAVCMGPNGDHILHMCPDGFVPSCAHGCSYPWGQGE